MTPRQLRAALKKVHKARGLLEWIDFDDGGEDWSLLSNAATALDMILQRHDRGTDPL